ncbi:MAG TPA: hypothetical protein VEP67_05070 [Thiobacillaceae bacterium]|nr:hypothetical protein [Thiobacillaceae bacterium]
MSRLWPETVQLVLAPSQAVLARRTPIAGRLKQIASEPLPVDVDAAAVAFAPLLDRWKLALGSRVCIIVAGDWVRHGLSPVADAVLSAGEEAILARQSFVERYGDSAGKLRVCHQAQGYRRPMIVAAMEANLMDRVLEACAVRGLRVIKVEPLLGAVWNKVGRSVAGRTGWFAVLEAGRLHLLWLEKGCWDRLASQRTYGSWSEAMALLRSREAAVMGRKDAALGEVVVYSAEPAIEIPVGRGWHWIAPPAREGSPSYANLVGAN